MQIESRVSEVAARTDLAEEYGRLYATHRGLVLEFEALNKAYVQTHEVLEALKVKFAEVSFARDTLANAARAKKTPVRRKNA
jgi:hypothetical protein